jgi:hypothetical protein
MRIVSSDLNNSEVLEVTRVLSIKYSSITYTTLKVGIPLHLPHYNNTRQFGFYFFAANCAGVQVFIVNA